jgi:hypothetical protein
MTAMLNNRNLGDSRGFPGKEHRKGRARTRTKMPSDQVVAINITNLVGRQLSIRIVGRNVYMRGARCDVAE